MTNWTELKRLAEEATPGPWEISEDSAGGRDELYCYWHRIGPIEIPGISADKNGLFIAAANPKNILAMIAENERLRADGNDVFGLAQARADTIDQLRAEVEALRQSVKDMLYAQHVRPSCQDGIVDRCRCWNCSSDRASAL